MHHIKTTFIFTLILFALSFYDVPPPPPPHTHGVPVVNLIILYCSLCSKPVTQLCPPVKPSRPPPPPQICTALYCYLSLKFILQWSLYVPRVAHENRGNHALYSTPLFSVSHYNYSVPSVSIHCLLNPTWLASTFISITYLI